MCGLSRYWSSRAVAATIPLALRTVYGAQVVPRAWSRSAVLSAASWLLAGPTMARQGSLATEAGANTPPTAAGTRTLTSASSLRRFEPLGVPAFGQLTSARVDIGDDQLRSCHSEMLGHQPADAAQPTTAKSVCASGCPASTC